MTAAAILIQAWPRSLTADGACGYCSCRRDELPPPSYGRGRTARWLREALDAHLDALAGTRSLKDDMMEAMR